MRRCGDWIFTFVPVFSCVICVALALPAFFVWLGLPPEGDAVDYRVPLIKWIVSNRAVPNWPWTFVDDYPLLGDLAMALFYAIHPNLMRFVPLIGYITAAYFAGKIYVHLIKERFSISPENQKLAFFTAAAWALGLRPLALQSNLLMVDTLASALTLGSLAYCLEKRPALSGLWAALALSTRYTTWANIAVIGAFHILQIAREKSGILARARNTLPFFLLAAIGALPWMIRNFLVNKNPIFPLASGIFNHYSIGVFENYGRGKSLMDFLLLPYDILYTNTFKTGFFDYTIGKLFYLQLGALLLAFLLRKTQALAALKALTSSRAAPLIAIFTFLHTLSWFLSSQQLRFLVPGLLLVNLGMLFVIQRAFSRPVLSLITLLTIFSAFSIEKDSIQIALGKKESPFQKQVTQARECFVRAGISENIIVGHFWRDGVLGFFTHAFVYGGSHSYFLKQNASRAPTPDFIYDPQHPDQRHTGYELWPREQPCIWKRFNKAEKMT